MVEKVDSLYDDSSCTNSSSSSSSTTLIVNADYVIDDISTLPEEEQVLLPTTTATSVLPTGTIQNDYVTFDDKTKNNDDQINNHEDQHNTRQENIQAAGIGSAVIGLVVGGPILAMICGFGAAYAAEKNEAVRNKFGSVWYKMKQWDRKFHLIECGINTIGKGTVWVIETITGKRHDDPSGGDNNSDNSIDSWIAAQQTPSATSK
jgi:phosphate-selective porin